MPGFEQNNNPQTFHDLIINEKLFSSSLSLRLEILLQHVMCWTLLAPVTHDAGGALHYLPCFALLVNLAQTSPFSQLHVGINLNFKI